jgi:hypothetical protein
MNAPSLIDFVLTPRQRRRQIKAETVNVHLLHPIAQAVHRSIANSRMRIFSVLPQPV